MAPKAKGQLAIDEEVREDDELNELLEARQELADAAAEARRALKPAHEAAVAAIDALGLSVGAVVRVGRFRIEHNETPARSVSFETQAKDRIAIALVE